MWKFFESKTNWLKIWGTSKCFFKVLIPHLVVKIPPEIQILATFKLRMATLVEHDAWNKRKWRIYDQVCRRMINTKIKRIVIYSKVIVLNIQMLIITVWERTFVQFCWDWVTYKYINTSKTVKVSPAQKKCLSMKKSPQFLNVPRHEPNQPNMQYWKPAKMCASW